MVSLVLLSSAALAFPPADATWETLQDKDVVVQCTESGGEPWCKAEGTVSAPIDKVAGTLEQFHTQAEVFDAVLEMNELEPGLLHVVLDYPWPVQDRDYVAKFSRSEEGAIKVYSWTPTTHASAPPSDERVRLTRMAGQWRLEAAGDNTQVTYLWHGDIGGSFPKAAYTKARKITGGEVFRDLSKALGAEIVKRP